MNYFIVFTFFLIFFSGCQPDEKGITSSENIFNLPSKPFPYNQAVDQPTELTLKWRRQNPDNQKITYNVYFGKEKSLQVPIQEKLTDTLCKISDIFPNTVYFWRIGVNTSSGETHSGPIWQFKTQYSGKLSFNGYTYNTVGIGIQEWTVENLRTTKYNDGTSILNLTDNSNWVSNKSGAFCSYNNDDSNVEKYGYLYNFYAVNSGKLAPLTGRWHVPSDTDWVDLKNFAGDNSGTKLKSKYDWGSEGNGTDDFGFSAIPGGGRLYGNGNFLNIGNYGYWWSSSVKDTNYAVFQYLYVYSSKAIISHNNRREGFSVRLVRHSKN